MKRTIKLTINVKTQWVSQNSRNWRITCNINRTFLINWERECRFYYCKLWNRPNNHHECKIFENFVKQCHVKMAQNVYTEKAHLFNQEQCCWTDWWNVKRFKTTVEGHISKVWTFFYCFWWDRWLEQYSLQFLSGPVTADLIFMKNWLNRPHCIILQQCGISLRKLGRLCITAFRF